MNNRILLPLLALTISACTQPSQPAADAVYTNARIYTVDSNNSWADAMAVTDGKIIALGSTDDVAAYTGDTTTVHDLEGRMVMPGIHDTHIHPSEAGIQKRLQCSFLEYQLDAALAIIKDCLAELGDGEWLRGGQWNDGLFIGVDKMPKEILDEIAPNNPIFLMDYSVHHGWVNSAALEFFGIDDDTPDPSGGVIVRDLETGEATGILYDNAAYTNQGGLPEYELEDRVDALAWSISEISKYGVTTIKDAYVTPAMIEAYALLDQKDGLRLNIKAALSWKMDFSSGEMSHEYETALIDSRADFATDRIDTNFAKIMLDGIPPTYTGATLEPYEPSEAFGDNWRGKLMHDPEVLAADVVALDAKGLTVKIHATADRSVRVALDAFEAARKANGDSGLIHEVSHAELIHPDDVPRFSELNVAAEMSPILWYPMLGLDWEAWFGPDRKPWPVKTMVESGALVIYGSDWHVVPTPNPWPGIESLVTRADPYSNGEETLWPEQAVDLATAIKIFTVNGAIANKVGETSGSLELGKDADFIVLDRQIFDVPITDVGETVILKSVVGGQAIINKL